MTRPAKYSVGALALLGLAGGLLLMPWSVRDVAPAAPLDFIPERFAGWTGSEHPETAILPPDPSVPLQISRMYQNGTRTLWVSVGYYPNQADGRRPPARDLLFPGRGWTDLTEHTVEIPVDPRGGRTIPANLVLMRTGERRLAILYWYQIQNRSIASDHWYRAVLLYNRLARHRADGALVRIASAVPDGADPEAVVAGETDFIRAFYPELLRSLPR